MRFGKPSILHQGSRGSQRNCAFIAQRPRPGSARDGVGLPGGPSTSRAAPRAATRAATRVWTTRVWTTRVWTSRVWTYRADLPNRPPAASPETARASAGSPRRPAVGVPERSIDATLPRASSNGKHPSCAGRLPPTSPTRRPTASHIAAKHPHSSRRFTANLRFHWLFGISKQLCRPPLCSNLHGFPAPFSRLLAPPLSRCPLHP